eukprot:1681919-Pyramimonas_sp.AAC.1
MIGNQCRRQPGPRRPRSAPHVPGHPHHPRQIEMQSDRGLSAHDRCQKVELLLFLGRDDLIARSRQHVGPPSFLSTTMHCDRLAPAGDPDFAATCA